MGSVIFIGGIHGVGKTTYCTNRLKEYEVLTCSGLIAKYKKLNKNKLTNDIAENQIILERAFNEYIDREKKIVLDGHFSLLDTNKEIVKIPVEVFEKLKISEIIILENEVEEIKKNLFKRDRIEYDLELLKRFQKVEIEQGQVVANEMNLNISIIKAY